MKSLFAAKVKSPEKAKTTAAPAKLNLKQKLRKKMAVNPVDSLVFKIKKANNAYYNDSSPILSDRDYDKLKDRLRDIDPDNAVLFEVGAPPPKSGEKTTLPIPMGSLNKQRPIEIARWILSQKEDFVVLPKLDGMSGLLHYKNEKLVGVYSRGNGFEGRMILNNARNIQGVLPTVHLPGEVLVKVEFVIHRHLFKVHGKTSGYSTPRNLAVGLLNRKDSSPLFPKLTAIAYEILHRKSSSSEFVRMDKYEQIKLLKEIGFTIANEPWRINRTKYDTILENLNKQWYENIINPKKANKISEAMVRESQKVPKAYRHHILPVYMSWSSISNYTAEDLAIFLVRSFFNYYKEYCDIDLDGIVVSLNDTKKAAKLDTDPLFPKSSFSMKLDPEDQTAKIANVVDIKWNMSPRKILKPVVQIKPLDFDGVKVEFVTGINAKNIETLEIGIGSWISVIRSGDVIPRIIKVTEKGKVKIPTHCPKCKKPLERTKTGVDIYCANINCTNDTAMIVRFFKTLNIQASGIGESTIAQLVEYCGKKNPNVGITDLLELTEFELKSLPGFAETSAKNTVEAMRKIVRESGLENLMHASGYFANETTALGSIRLKSIIDSFGEDVILRDVFLEESFESVNIIGIAKASVDIFLDGITKYQALHRKLLPYLGKGKKIEKKSNILEGQVVCFTGFRDTLVEKKIIENGGTISHNMTKKVTLLLSDGKKSTKTEYAEKNGIKVMVRTQIDGMFK